MKKMRLWKPVFFFLCSILCIQLLQAQTSVTIRGSVKDSANKALSRASVLIKGSGQGTTADENGNFSITTKMPLPLTIIISSTGYFDQNVTVTSTNETVNMVLVANTGLGEVIVTGGNRLPERYIESPVSIERIGATAIRNAAAPNYYSGIANLKGVDLTTSSLTFQTISTRGFNGSGNLRFNQLIEGMDNQAPGLSFSVGNIIGLTELDVDNVELLPGASSALYGSGGMNGTLLMTGKNPFKYQGLSVQYKQGVNHLSDYRRSAAPVFDGEIRYAKAFKNKAGKDKFAFKLAGKYFNAQDWQADDSSNLLRNNVNSKITSGNRTTDPNYDGVNVFGDEVSASMSALAKATRAGAPIPAGITDQLLKLSFKPQEIYNYFISNPLLRPAANLVPSFISTSSEQPPYPIDIYGNQFVSRQGYAEKNLVDYNAYNFKVTGGLYYKITNDIEASVQAYFGRGTTVYTGSDRYSLKNLQVGQYKFELRSTNWFLRGYTTQENSGDSYTATTAAVAINRAWKTDSLWFRNYTDKYGAARLGIGNNNVPIPEQQARQTARDTAEFGRYLPGTQQFQNAFNKAVSTSISQGGAKFADRTSLYHAEGQYNFSNLVKVVDVLAGANYRLYHLNSGNTIFLEPDGPINIYEYGGYLQLQKKFLKDILKLTASGRFDKSKNFKGRFTPRFSALVKVAKDNNIRLSYQVAYRFPSTQDQYINLQTPGSLLIGGLPLFKTLYRFDVAPAYTAESIVAYRNSKPLNPALLQIAPFNPIKPETVNSYEIGYRGLITKNLLIDAYGYMSRYKNFIGRVAVGRGKSASTVDSIKYAELASPFTTTNYSFAVNSPQTMQASGWGLGVEYRFQKKYAATLNISGDQLSNVPEGFISFFNAPKIRYNIGISSPAEAKNFGFSVIYRWQDKVNWEGTFGSAQIPSFGTMDAQISYLLPKVKTLIKLGGSNVFNAYYRSAFGNPYVGALYYVSFGYNIL